MTGTAPRPHVANIDFPAFYAPAFANDEDRAREFYEEITNRTAKIILHQAARMLWLSDRVDEVSRGRPALRILFFAIAAEAVAKLTDGFEGEGKSRAYVQHIFREICSDEHRSLLGRAFQSSAGQWLSPLDAVDFLYDVRCDVAHRGQYYDLNLPRPEVGETELFTSSAGDSLIAHLTASQLRQIVLEGAVLAARRLNP